MENKVLTNNELLRAFIKDNFNRENFEIEWLCDYCVRLTDCEGSHITLDTLCDSYIVHSAINGEDFLSYVRSYHKPSNTYNWQVISK